MPQKGTTIHPLPQAIDQRQQSVVQSLQSRASEIPGVNAPNGADVRDLMPTQDLTATTDNGWSQSDQEWLQSGMTADTLFNAYDIDSNNQAQNKIVSIYGVANVADDPLTTTIEFQDGTGAGFYEANVETFEIVDISDVILFNQDITYGVNQGGTVVQYPNADGDDKVVYLGKVIEQSGNTVTERGN